MTLIQDVTPDYLRRYLLAFSETHNLGGVHAAYRSLRAFFRWLMNEEVMPPEWKNPILKVKPPKVSLEPLEPISIEDIAALIGTCKHGEFAGERDRAIFLFLLDTGARAQELCKTNIEDADLNTGASKILFAWRPQALIPWDVPMRAEWKLDGSASSYLLYLRKTRGHLQELSRDCRNAGFEIEDLPAILGRPRSTLVKLMDEYSWVTISRKCPTPDRAVFQKWISWS